MTINVDRFGAGAGTLCAVHCAVVGFALGALPALGLAWLAHPVTELAFFGSAVVLGVWATVRGLRAHRRWGPPALFAAGLSTVAIAHFVFGTNCCPHNPWVVALIPSGSEGWPWGTGLAVAGGLTLAAFHVLNERLTRRARRQLNQA